MSGNTAVTVSEQYLANQAGEPVETAIPAGTAVNKAADAAIAGSEAFPFTDINAYTAAVKMHGLDGKDVYVDIKGQEFSAENGTYFEVANTQSYANPPKLHLTLTGCTFTGNTACLLYTSHLCGKYDSFFQAVSLTAYIECGTSIHKNSISLMTLFTV